MEYLALFDRIHGGDVEILGWRDFNPQIGSMIEMTNYSSLIVGAVMFLLASLGIINSTFMSIYERIFKFGIIPGASSGLY